MLCRVLEVPHPYLAHFVYIGTDRADYLLLPILLANFVLTIDPKLEDL